MTTPRVIRSEEDRVIRFRRHTRSGIPVPPYVPCDLGKGVKTALVLHTQGCQPLQLSDAKRLSEKIVQELSAIVCGADSWLLGLEYLPRDLIPVTLSAAAVLAEATGKAWTRQRYLEMCDALGTLRSRLDQIATHFEFVEEDRYGRVEQCNQE